MLFERSRTRRIGTFVLGVVGTLIVTGCTVHPGGEGAERSAAQAAGAPYDRHFESRQLPPLSGAPSPDDLVRHALMANAELEQRYWEWRAAIEQIPQDGTQPTNLVVSVAPTLHHGTPAWDSTTLTFGNDPMADIVWPGKLSVAAERAMENARAAGMRFQKARDGLRAKVLAAYYDYVLTGELIASEEEGAALLSATASAVEARNRVGSAGQQEVLKARMDLDLSSNQIAVLRSRSIAQLADLNSLLGRDPRTPVALPKEQMPVRALSYSDEEIIMLAASHNPELAALAAEINAKGQSVRLARLQYVPDFSLSTGTDLAGVTQSFFAAVTVPILRADALHAAVEQAQANLLAAESMRRQSKSDLSARVTDDLVTLHDAHRQIAFLREMILPRAAQRVALVRVAYESGQSTLSDLLDAQRSQLEFHRLESTLRTTYNIRVADLEAVTQMPV